MERRAERATALGGACVLAISVASIRGKIDHPGAATTGGRPEVAKPFQTDESRKPFFPARFRDLAMRSESDWGRQSVDSSRPWPVHFSASYVLLPCRYLPPTRPSWPSESPCSNGAKASSRFLACVVARSGDGRATTRAPEASASPSDRPRARSTRSGEGDPRSARETTGGAAPRARDHPARFSTPRGDGRGAFSGAGIVGSGPRVPRA